MRFLLPLALLAACSQAVGVSNPAATGIPTDPPAEDPTAPPTAPPSNEPPVARAGEDFTAFVAEQVELDGSASYDPDGDLIAFEWALISVPAGSAAELINEVRPNPSFFADLPGTYVAEVAVEDGRAVATDQVAVEVVAPNDGPVANAGPDQTVDVGDQVVLNGSGSFDPDGDALGFAWILVAVPSGSVAVLDDPASPLPQFTADLAGIYRADLMVTDGVETSPADQITVTALEATDGGCFSCAMAQRRLGPQALEGGSASVGPLLLLPLGLMLWVRRRRR